MSSCLCWISFFRELVLVIHRFSQVVTLWGIESKISVAWNEFAFVRGWVAFRVGQCTSPSTKGKKGVGRGRRVRDGGGGEGTECLSIFEAQPKLCVTILLELWQTLNISPNHKREKIQSLTYSRWFSEYLKMLNQFAIIVEQNDLH